MSIAGKNDRAWFLVYTKPRAENLAQENLLRQGFDTYLPLIRTKRRKQGKYVAVVEAMFSRYLFIHLNFTTDNWSPIRSTIGVANMVRFNGLPSMVPAALIESIKAMEDEQGVHKMPEKEFKEGDSVSIIDGVFAGLKGIFQARTSQERVVVLLDIAGQYTRVNMNKNELLYA